MASVRQRVQKSGAVSWAVLWRDPDLGKQTSMTFPTEAQAETLKRLLNANDQRFAIAEQMLAAAASKAPTVADVLTRHIDLLTRPNEGTLEEYRRIAERHIVPELGALRADRITDEDVKRWVQRATRDGVARKTLSNRMGLLSAACKTAVRKGWMPSNPCEGIQLPEDKRPGRRATFLSRAEYDLILQKIHPRHQLLVKTLAGTGMRFSEATALTWDDLVLDSSVPHIVVDKAWKTVAKRRFEVRRPKSEAAIREVSIAPSLAEELGSAARRGDLVFPSTTGGQLTNTTFHQHGWGDAIIAARAAGLRKAPRPHDLRHSHASWLLMEGVPTFVVSRRLGHASVDITTRIYGHIAPKSQRDAADAIARVLG